MRDAIIHARLIVGDAVLMGSDSPPQFYSAPGGFTNTLVVDTAEEAERLFVALSENATVTTPMEENFFAIRFGSLDDQFGMPWMVICEKSMG